MHRRIEQNERPMLTVGPPVVLELGFASVSHGLRGGPHVPLRFHPDIEPSGQICLEFNEPRILNQVIEAMGIIRYIVKFLGGTVLVFLSHGKCMGIARLCLFYPGHPEIGLITPGSRDKVLERFGRIEVADIAVGFGPGRTHAEIL